MNLTYFEEYFYQDIIKRGRLLYHQKRFDFIEQDPDNPNDWQAIVQGAQIKGTWPTRCWPAPT